MSNRKPLNAVIAVSIVPCPYKPNTKAANTYALFRDGDTVSDFLAKCAEQRDVVEPAYLNYASRDGVITLFCGNDIIATTPSKFDRPSMQAGFVKGTHQPAKPKTPKTTSTGLVLEAAPKKVKPAKQAKAEAKAISFFTEQETLKQVKASATPSKVYSMGKQIAAKLQQSAVL